MYSTTHQIKSSPLALLPAIIDMIQENNDMKPGYGLTWEILKRAFRFSGFFDLLHQMQGNRSQVVTSGPVLQGISEKMKEGDLQTIEVMRKIQQVYIKESATILKTGKLINKSKLKGSSDPA